MDARSQFDLELSKEPEGTLIAHPRSGKDQSRAANWSAYAASYDLLLEHNPAYQMLLGRFKDLLASRPPPSVIYDIGGGTGNYTEIAAKMCPESTTYLVEPDPEMIAHARGKLRGFMNVGYINRPLQDLEPTDKADLVICVHALYAMPDPTDRLAELRALLRPGGLLFLVDLGRPMNVSDWRSYIFAHLIKELGLVKALQVLWQGREIAKQNKAIFKAQQEGVYWTHSEGEITSAVKEAGFEVISQDVVYRGYSDHLLCRALN